MAPTLRRVVTITSLRLRVLAGAADLDRPVRWVAVSELEDPTPFLEGGELVLTTGMRLAAPDAGPYVSRLVERGTTGLGFGVGLGHDDVPAELIAAAARAGLPLVEVPRQTPFIAIGKAVSDLLAAERYEELSSAFAAQERLTRAALRPGGLAAVIDSLAREIHGWAVLLGPDGEPRHQAGEGAAEGTGLVRAEVARLRSPGAPSSLALSGPARHVVVRPLGERERVRGFFAAGADRPFTPVAHTIVNTAGSLLALSLARGRDQLAAARRVRAAVLELLLAGGHEAAERAVAALGDAPPSGPVVVLACDPADADALYDALPGFTAPFDDLVVALVPASEAERAAAIAGTHGRAGVSAPVRTGELATGLDQARLALGSADPVTRFADLAGQGLMSLVDPGLLSGFAASLLAPLRDYGSRADLVESLRAYLACNGHWDAAAQRLGVHRHTLRYRMRRVAELLGRDLDDPAVRAELWVALSARSHTGRQSETGNASL